MAGRLGGWAVTVACFVLPKYIREHASTASAKAAVAKQMAEPWRKCNINRAKTRRWPVPHLKIEKENTRLGKVRRHRIKCNRLLRNHRYTKITPSVFESNIHSNYR